MAKRGNSSSSSSSMVMKLVLVLSLATRALCNNNGHEFRAFYFMQQWLGSYCNQQGTRCCYPPTGKPKADFTVYGLWPYFSDDTFPANCPGSSFDVAPLKRIEGSLQKAWPSLTCPLIGRKFWLHEWNKRGTCSKSILSEMAYFKATIDLKKKINLLRALAKAGIRPDNRSYPFKSVKNAIFRAFGFHPWVTCNHNAQGKSQIWQITMCVDKTATRLVNCPNIPNGRGSCANSIMFPSF